MCGNRNSNKAVFWTSTPLGEKKNRREHVVRIKIMEKKKDFSYDKRNKQIETQFGRRGALILESKG